MASCRLCASGGGSWRPCRSCARLVRRAAAAPPGPQRGAGRARSRSDGRVQGLAAAAGGASRAGQQAVGRRRQRIPRPNGLAQRVSGRRQQVGFVVRAVPDRVPRLPEGGRQVRAQGRVHRDRRQGQSERGRRPRSSSASRSPIRATPIRTSRIASLDPGLDLLSRRRSTSTATARYVFDHAGPYESAAALEQDIRRYALK